MKNIYRKFIFSPGSNFTLNELDRCDIKFLLELMHEESKTQVIEYADGIDWL